MRGERSTTTPLRQLKSFGKLLHVSYSYKIYLHHTHKLLHGFGCDTVHCYNSSMLYYYILLYLEIEQTELQTPN